MRIKRQTVTEYHDPTWRIIQISAGIAFAGMFVLPGGCATMDGLGRDISRSAKIVQEWMAKPEDEEVTQWQMTK